MKKEQRYIKPYSRGSTFSPARCDYDPRIGFRRNGRSEKY